MVGTVSNVLTSKMYGFISGENGQEYFFHKEDAKGCWEEIIERFAGEGAGSIRVDFETIKTPKGPRAANVVLLDL